MLLGHFPPIQPLSIVNLYSTRSVGNVIDIADHIGPLNDLVITHTIADASVLILAWDPKNCLMLRSPIVALSWLTLFENV